ncbi:MAG: serine/threonine-protein kinase [Gemmatimonadaceae bacterium]
MTTPTAEFETLASALKGQYHVEREVGRGGMGVVYAAHDERLDRRVAIKTLPPHLTTDATVRDRFLREARTAAALSHPNIVPVHRADDIAGAVFFVMGFVDGESLAHRIQRAGPLSPRELVPILHDVLDALGYAHTRGVIHRDVKAENILLDRQTGRAMVTDFGIARVAAAAPMTATGTVLGTVAYMSPEQVAGDQLDGRSDLYSFGVLAFYALAGRFPFESPTPSAVLVAHVTKQPPALRDVAPRVPAAVAAIVDRLLNKDPADRFEYAEEVLEELVNVERDLVASGEGDVVSSTEAHAVWERAAYLQEMTGHDVAPPELRKQNTPRRPVSLTSGYKVDEVREAAEAVGIKDKYVERALAERRDIATPPTGVRPGVAEYKNRFLGDSTTLSFEAVVDGEMRERDFDLMIDVIRRALNDTGNVSAVGRSLSWASADKQRKVQVSVLVRDGRTSIYVSERLRDLAGGLFGGIMGGGGGGMIGPSIAFGVEVIGSPFAALGCVLASIGVGYTIARIIFTSIARKRRAVLKEMTERLVEQAKRSLAPLPLTGGREARRLPR